MVELNEMKGNSMAHILRRRYIHVHIASHLMIVSCCTWSLQIADVFSDMKLLRAADAAGNMYFSLDQLEDIQWRHCAYVI
jgi:hypothetical protein